VRDSIGTSQPALQHEAPAFEHQRVRNVVDVLGGAGEVHELGSRRQRGVVGGAPLDPVLDRLDVVIGLGLDRLDLGTVGRCEGPNQGAQALDRRRRNGREVRQTGRRERREPLDLDAQALAHEGELGKNFA
jgi:hypothetical protein